MKFFFNLLSYLFHPVFTPLLSIWSLLFMAKSSGYLPTSFNDTYILLIVLINMVFIPLISLVFLKKMKLISDYKMRDKKSRKIPLLITICYAILTYFILRKIYIPLLWPMFFGEIIVLILILLITPKIKISMHLAGFSGFFGSLYSSMLFFKIDGYIILICVSFIIGLLGSSRLYLKAHSLTEILVGSFVGFICVWFCMNQNLFI